MGEGRRGGGVGVGGGGAGLRGVYARAAAAKGRCCSVVGERRPPRPLSARAGAAANGQPPPTPDRDLYLFFFFLSRCRCWSAAQRRRRWPTVFVATVTPMGGCLDTPPPLTLSPFPIVQKRTMTRQARSPQAVPSVAFR